jgi:hypothetical protein
LPDSDPLPSTTLTRCLVRDGSCNIDHFVVQFLCGFVKLSRSSDTISILFSSHLHYLNTALRAT